MVPSFNTAGPCVPGEHYMLPPEQRMGQVMQLIDEKKFFVLHAGRQTGKTTAAQWLVQHYNRQGRYCALWVDLETAREQPETRSAFRTILNVLHDAVCLFLPSVKPPERESLLEDPETAILRYLRTLSKCTEHPLVLLFDEADALVGPTMVSFLTQLRAGYLQRSLQPFPYSVALIGMRQIRDFLLSSDDRQPLRWLGTASPFNITAEATTLGSFSEQEVGALLAQHTTATGQAFSADAVARIYYLSQGHPWLVNAMADQIVRRDVTDRSVAALAAHVDAAKETIILERRTHVDSLVARLREDRVRRVLQPMLVGEVLTDSDTLNDDVSYVQGLGLLVRRGGHYQLANPIYQEIVPRALNYAQQYSIDQETSWYVSADGTLDLTKLMAAWQQFWRKDGHLAAAGFAYREAGPHLMLMAFLQRIINGGGRIEREYGLGRGALDLMVCWKGQRYAIEVKLRRDSETLADALEQTARYLDGAGLEKGWLVLFDLRKRRSWQAKLFTRAKKVDGKRIEVVGC